MQYQPRQPPHPFDSSAKTKPKELEQARGEESQWKKGALNENEKSSLPQVQKNKTLRRIARRNGKIQFPHFALKDLMERPE